MEPKESLAVRDTHSLHFSTADIRYLKGRKQFKMNNSVSTVPDKVLRLTQFLPWPASSGLFNALRRAYKKRGQLTGELTRIRFGTVQITAPLEHPAVYWRYRPAGFNQNFLLLVKRILEVRTGLIVDVGANIGDGIALMRGSGVSAPVLAIEGAEVWFDFLKSNTRTFPNVELENVFLGSLEEENHVALQVQDGTSKLIDGDSAIKITSLDTLMLHHKKHPVVLLKTDTDGFDAKVLFGAKALLTKQKPIVFAEVDDGLLREQGNSSQELIQYLAQCGYSSIAAWHNGGRWLTSRPITQGIDDLIAHHPGGLGKDYLDVAVFSNADQFIFDSLKGGI